MNQCTVLSSSSSANAEIHSLAYYYSEALACIHGAFAAFGEGERGREGGREKGREGGREEGREEGRWQGCYYGEYPQSFAASVGNVNMCKLLYAHRFRRVCHAGSKSADGQTGCNSTGIQYI
jgi:hypothetical protein